MEIITVILAIIVGVVVILALTWRPPRGRRGSVDEAQASDALRSEREKNLTDAEQESTHQRLRGGRWGY